MSKRIRYRGRMYEAVLDEAKADEEKFRAWAGNSVADAFYKLKPRMKAPENDIYYWMKKDKKELDDFLTNLLLSKTDKQLRDEARKGAKKVYSDSDWDVYHITSYAASQQYGKDTKWCITGSKEANTNGRGGEYWWNYYTNNGVEFYFYFDKKNNTKYALALYPDVERCEMFDAEDNQIGDIPNRPDVDEIVVHISSAEVEIKLCELCDWTLVEYIIEDYQGLAEYNNYDWWLSDAMDDEGDNEIGSACYVDWYGDIVATQYSETEEDSNITEHKAVRPYLVMDGFNFDGGDTVNIDGQPWVYLGNYVGMGNCYLYNGRIETSIFDGESNEYYGSEVQKFVRSHFPHGKATVTYQS